MRQHAGFAIDVGDLALDRRGCAVAGIVGEGAEFLGERRDVHHRRAEVPERTGSDGLLAGSGIDEFEFFIGHDGEALQERGVLTMNLSEPYMVRARNQGNGGANRALRRE